MANNSYILYMLMVLSSMILIVLAIYLFRQNDKKYFHYAFIVYMFLIVVWGLGHIIWTIMFQKGNSYYVFVMNITFTIVCFIPVLFLLICASFTCSHIKVRYKKLALLVVPIITSILIWTNDKHHLYFRRIYLENMEFELGYYFYFHATYSYLLILAGLVYLTYFSIKNSGFFSKQVLLIIIGTVVPVITNVLISYKIASLSLNYSVIALNFSTVCYAIAIFRYDFLNILPIALQTVVDHISDSFIVLDSTMRIVDYNKTFVDTFSDVVSIRRKQSLIDLINTNGQINVDPNRIVETIERSINENKSYKFEHHMKLSDRLDRYYEIEITPIISNRNHIGTIILLKDITELKQNQEKLLEREKLASLGQLIGGIAHNLRTPIMSVAGCADAVKDLVLEYKASIGDREVTIEDHKAIAEEMLEWLNKIPPQCTYMSDIISAVKGQTVNAHTEEEFRFEELIQRIKLLTSHELKMYRCKMHVDIKVDREVKFKGEISNLIQVFNNLIINAIEAYEGSPGIIDFVVREKDGVVEFIVRDYGIGIPEDVENRLFKEMVTTKGKNGTGLGLYISYATIKGQFGGNMWAEKGRVNGTVFHISIPASM